MSALTTDEELIVRNKEKCCDGKCIVGRLASIARRLDGELIELRRVANEHHVGWEEVK